MQLKTTTTAVIGILIAGFVSGALSMPGGNIVKAATETLQKAGDVLQVAGTDKQPDEPDTSKTAAKPSPAEANQDRAQVDNPVTKSSPSGTAVVPSAHPGHIGVFVSDSPVDSGSLSRLDTLAGLGVDTIYNYTVLDGNEAQIRAYLDRAQARGISVIISLKDLYDQLGTNNYRDLYSTPLGANNEEAALNAVRLFGNHPAVWGFATSDESPEAPSELGVWQGTLQQRYSRIKQLTAKPVMLVLVGATSPSAAERQQFLRALRSATDTFALDYYPIPYQSTAMISSIAQDLRAANDSNGWFIAQSFSWASYPGTARGLGFDLGAARYPTTQEMVNMAALALNGGARNILYYSYFDIASNPSQVSALRSAIAQLRH